MEINWPDAQVVRIPFAQTAVNYGNTRYWIHCPLPKCQRRCGRLYLCRISDGVYAFICRKCLNLAYRSQNKGILDRMIDKKWNLIHKLEGDSNWDFNKPKWMHWKTFYRMKEEVETLDRIIILCGAAKFSHLKGCEMFSELF